MGGLILLVACIALFVIQIVLLVKSIKKKNKKYWIGIFSLEIFPIIILLILFYYYENLAPRGGFMPGLDYLGEELICIGTSILYCIMLCVTMIAGIIVFEKNRKIQGKKSANPLMLIIAFALIMIGAIFLIVEIKDNFGKVKTIGTVVDFEDTKSGGDYRYWPIFQFYVDGQEYQNSYPMLDAEIGDTVVIYYSPRDDYRITRHLTNNKIIWIPTILIGILIIFLRFKDDIIKSEK